MQEEIVVVGFPKCGTTALMRAFESDADVSLLYQPDGAVEVAWPAIRSIEKPVGSGTIIAHKFTAYIYNENALNWLATDNPNSIFVVCVRDPVRALISWRKMHQSIATSGKNTNHFAWQERDFYADCSIQDYFDRFAQRRLRYQNHLRTLVDAVGPGRICVVSQERMAQDLGSVVSYLKDLARGKGGLPPAAPTGGDVHVGYGDRAPDQVPIAIRNELRRNEEAMQTLISEHNLVFCR